MIDKLKSASPLMASRPPQAPKGAETASTQPNDGMQWSTPDFKLAGPPKFDNLQEADKPQVKASGLAEWGKKLGLGAALTITGVVGLAGAANAQTAQVQVQSNATAGQTMTLAQAVRAASNRDQTPVHTNSVQEVVNRFDASQQIYVVGAPQYQGQPLSANDYAQLQSIMKEHPNAYVVLIANSSNIKDDDWVLSRGIGENPGFTANVDPRTGDRNGEVFMIYFKTTDQSFINRTGKDRAMFMRSEQLLDDAGVGENDFVDRETLQNKELFNLYIQGIQSGKSVPMALNGVLERIDAGVDSYITNTVQGAQSAVTAGQSALSNVEPKIRDFQRLHGSNGQLGSPDVNGWKAKLDQAQQLVNQRNYRGALDLVKQVQSSISQWETAATNFSNAPGVAQQAQALIDQAEAQLPSLENNGPAQAARRNIAEAKDELKAYQASYAANNPDYQQHLNRASELSQSAIDKVAASRSQTETIKNVKLYGGGALAAVLLLTGGLLNHRARKKKDEAEGVVDEELAKLGEKSKELIRIMNSESYDDVSQYTGKTQKMANELIASTADSLALMGGGEKFIAEAKSMIAGKTIGQRLKNMFATGNFSKAVELLTGGEKLPFDLSDSQRAELEKGSHAEAWRDTILAQVPAKPFEDTLSGILEQMGAHAGTNDKLVTTIQTKAREVGNYLNAVQAESQALVEKSSKLQEAGKDDGLFISPSVTKRLMPFVLGSEGQPGLLDKGNQVKKQDPVRAWEEFADVGKRMATEGNQIVDVGQGARDNLLPALKTADEALHPHQVQTAWAHSRKDELSIALDRTGEKAVSGAVAAEVNGLKNDIAALQSRVETVVEQDTERREVSPGLITDAEADVNTAREGLAKALKAAGVFAGGSADQVLREPDRDPTTQTEKSHQDWSQIKGHLDLGKIEEAGALLQNIRTQTATAHDLVKQSRDAFNSYTATSQERISRRDNIGKSIKETYADSLKRTQAGYNAAAQKAAAAEVHNGNNDKVGTVADYLTNAQNQLETSGSLNSQAQANYERAYLLTSRDQLTDSDKQLKVAKANLEAITAAEKTLNNHQAEAERELTALTGRVQNTSGKTGAEYVRGKAKNLVSQTQNALNQARSAVGARPADPYAAKAALASVENLRTQAESTIDYDHRCFDSARSAISSAESEIRSAESTISHVNNMSWSTYVSDFGSVSHSVSSSDLSGARSYVNSARSELSSARSKMSSQDYEGAKSSADSANSSANRAESEANSVASRERSQYNSMVAAAEAEARRRRKEREEAASHHHSGGGGGGGGGHHGGSGSTGGGW
ncbi:MAG: hypothetical protein KF760_05180 [Candidatus Eremiobacteraeota bacterium]|nr:hypothetical protein [Candidatus Eremiobacteraeota bacterium]